MSNSNIETMQVVILIIVAVALLLQASFVVVLLVVLGKLGKSVKDEVSDLRGSVMPVVFDTRELLTKISPKIESAAEDLSAVLRTVRSQTTAFESVGTDIVGRVKHQSARLDEMVSGLMDTADRTGNAVAETVGRPIRRLAGLVASARAVVDTLRRPPHTTVHATREPEKRDVVV